MERRRARDRPTRGFDDPRRFTPNVEADRVDGQSPLANKKRKRNFDSDGDYIERPKKKFENLVPQNSVDEVEEAEVVDDALIVKVPRLREPKYSAYPGFKRLDVDPVLEPEYSPFAAVTRARPSMSVPVFKELAGPLTERTLRLHSFYRNIVAYQRIAVETVVSRLYIFLQNMVEIVEARCHYYRHFNVPIPFIDMQLFEDHFRQFVEVGGWESSLAELRNRLMHAYNGNTVRMVDTDGRSVFSRKIGKIEERWIDGEWISYDRLCQKYDAIIGVDDYDDFYPHLEEYDDAVINQVDWDWNHWEVRSRGDERFNQNDMQFHYVEKIVRLRDLLLLHQHSPELSELLGWNLDVAGYMELVPRRFFAGDCSVDRFDAFRGYVRYVPQLDFEWYAQGTEHVGELLEYLTITKRMVNYFINYENVVQDLKRFKRLRHVAKPQMRRVDEVKCSRARRTIYVKRLENREYYHVNVDSKVCESSERVRVRRQKLYPAKEAEAGYYMPWLSQLYGVDYDVCEAVIFGFPASRVLNANGKPMTKRELKKAIGHMDSVVKAIIRKTGGEPIRALAQMGKLSDTMESVKNVAKTILDALGNFNTLVEAGQEFFKSVKDGCMPFETDYTFSGIRSVISFILDVVQCTLVSGKALAVHITNMTLRYVVPTAPIIFTVLSQLFQEPEEIDVDGVKIKRRVIENIYYSEHGEDVRNEEVLESWAKGDLRPADEDGDSREEDWMNRKRADVVKAKPQGGKVIDETLVLTVVRFMRSLVFGGDLSDTRARADVITKSMQTVLTGKNFFFLMRDAFKYVVETFGEPEISLTLREDLLNWQKDVMVLLNYPPTEMSLQRAESVIFLYGRMRELARKVGEEKLTIEHLNFLPSTITRLTTYYTAACAYKQVVPVRHEPVGLLFEGAPGIGKSQAVGSLILTAVAGALGVVPDRSDVYNRNPKDPWFDGMSAHCVGIVYDDANVVEDSQIRVTEQMEIMGLVSSGTYMAPAAALDLKANHCFTGYVVAANVNNKSKLTTGMLQPNALWRRLLIVKAMLVDPNNYDPIKKRAVSYAADFSHLKFSVFVGDESGGKNQVTEKAFEYGGRNYQDCSFAELCELVSRLIIDRIHNAEATLRSTVASDVGLANYNKIHAKPQMFGVLADRWKKWGKEKEKEKVKIEFIEVVKDETSSSPPTNEEIRHEVLSILLRQGEKIELDEIQRALVVFEPLVKEMVPNYCESVVGARKTKVLTETEALEAQKKKFIYPEDDPKWREWLKRYWKPAAGVLTLAVTVGVSALVYHLWSHEDEEEEEARPQTTYSRNVPTSHGRRYQGVRRTVQSAHPQMSYREKETGLEVLPLGPNDLITGNPQVANLHMIQKLAKVRGNIGHVDVCVEGDTVMEKFGSLGVFTKGTKFMTAAHIIGGVEELLKNGIEKSKIIVRLTRSKAVWDFRYTECRFEICDLYEDIADIGFMYFPPGPVGPFADIEHFFAPTKVLSNEIVDLYHVIPDECIGDQTFLIKHEIAQIYGKRVETQVGERVFTTASSVISSGIDGEGYCGAITVCMNPKVPWFILGLHYAALGHGGKARTLTAIVTQDFLRDVDAKVTAVPQYKLAFDDVLNDCVYDSRRQGVTFPENVQFLGHVKKQFAVPRSRETKIVPSLIYDINESTHAPAQLVPIMKEGMLIRPFDQVVEKWSAAPCLVNPDHEVFIRMAYEHIRLRIMDVKPRLYRTLGLGEEYNTIPPLEKGSVNVRASLGHPMKQLFPGKGKQGAVVMGSNLKFEPTAAALKYLIKVVNQLANKEIPNLFAEMTMKDELRELLKVIKPRGFGAGSHALNSIGEMVFSQFLETFRNTERGLCIGTDMTGTEVLGVYENFVICFGKDAILHAEDSERNDTRFRRRFTTDFFKLSKEYYSRYFDPDSAFHVPQFDEECEYLHIPLSGKKGYEFACVVRDTIAKMIESPYVVWNDVLVQMLDKLISGVFCTIHINGFGNLLAAYSAVFKSCFEHNVYVTPQSVDSLIKIAGIGDDILGSASKELGFFTQDEMKKQIKEIWDRTVTSVANKTRPGELGELHLAPLNGDDKGAVTLMKRYFVERNHQLFAPLQMDVIREIPNWVNQDNRPMAERTREVAEASLREWFFWGPEIFEREKKKLNLRLLSAKLEPITLEFVTLLADWCRRH